MSEIDRKTFLGGSDCAAILGLSPWRTPLQVWEEKLGLEEVHSPKKQKVLDRGKRFEPVIREMVREEQGLEIVRVNQRYTHPEYPFIGCELDFETPTQNGEIKSVQAFAAKEWGDEDTDECPQPYVVQCVHGLAVVNRNETILAALIGTDDLRVYRIQRDRELEGMLLNELRKFWTLVQTKRAPEPITLEDALRLHPRSLGKVIQVTKEVAEAFARVKADRDEQKRLEKAIEADKFIIASAMGDADTAAYEGRIIGTFKTQEQQRTDGELLKSKFPDVYAAVKHTISFRVLRVK